MELGHHLALIYSLIGFLIFAIIFVCIRMFTLNHAFAKSHKNYGMSMQEFEQHMRNVFESDNVVQHIIGVLTRQNEGQESMSAPNTASPSQPLSLLTPSPSSHEESSLLSCDTQNHSGSPLSIEYQSLHSANELFFFWNKICRSADGEQFTPSKPEKKPL